MPENIDSNEMIGNSIWDEYDTRCIGCGRCNFVCPTCSCFTMQDIFYKENENVGERRRVWASCQVDGYTDIAGGNSIICVLVVEDVMMPVRNTYHFQSV